MKQKIIISSVCLILVVGVVIGAVVINGGNKSEESQVATHNNAVKSVCQNSQHPHLCEDTLSKVNSSDPNAFIAAAVKASADTVIKGLNLTDRLSVEQKSKADAHLKMAIDDCKDLLESAMDSIELSMNLVNQNNIQAVQDQTADLKNWLSAVISYRQACMEGFDSGKDGEQVVKEQLQTDSLDQMGKITGVALDIVADLSKMLEKFNLDINVKPAARRLLAMDIDEEGLPTWLSAADRKLLGKKGKKGQGKGTPVVIAPASQVGMSVVVAQDGSGQFKTVKEAIDAYPPGLVGRYVITIKSGVYDEYITVPKTSINILMIGDGPTRPIITGNKNYGIDKYTTKMSATFANSAAGFIAKNIAFENTIGPKGHQAVAFRNEGDMVALFGCSFHGYQDTLYTQSNRQFYRDCEISGTVDFIFGTAPALIQNSKIIVRMPDPNQFNAVTADGTEALNMVTGIVLQKCQIEAEPQLEAVKATVRSYLGRPWKAYSTAVIMDSVISDVISPEGWTPWKGPNDPFINTLYFAEIGNTGPGANLAGRVKWPGYHPNINRAEAARFTAGLFLKSQQGNLAEEWLGATQVPFALGFF